MGNSQSNNAPQPSSSPSRSPGPGNPHPSLRQKKKSLELPDLALLSLTATPYELHARRGRSPAPNPPKSASIPIPGHTEGRSLREIENSRDRGRGTQGREVFPVQPSSTIERNLNPNRKPKTERENESPHRRGRARPSGHGYGNGYAIGGSTYGYVPSNLSLVTNGSSNSDNHDSTESATLVPNAPPPSLSASPAPIDGEIRTPLVVRSSLPLALPRVLTMERPPTSPVRRFTEDEEEVSHVEDISAVREGDRDHRDTRTQDERFREGEEPEADVMVKISWKAGGYKVFLARAGDNDWRGRTEMFSESPTSSIASTTSFNTTFSTTIHLQPGTHHFRFLVDDQWRVSDDYQTAVDETGNLTNYLEVSTSTRASTELQRDASHCKEKEKDDMGAVQSKGSSKARAIKHKPPPSRSHAEVKLSLDIPSPDTLQPVQYTGPEASTTPGTVTGISPPSTTPLVIHSNADPFPIDLAAASPRVIHAEDAEGDTSGSRGPRPPGYGYGYSFWSMSSTTEGEVEVVGGPEESPTSSQAGDGVHGNGGDSGVVNGLDHKNGRKGRGVEKGRLTKAKSKSKVKYDPRWTTEIPLELIEAAKEEEDYLAYQAELKERNGRNSQHTKVNGFHPIPNIPHAPGLPRYLDKLILNTPVQPRNVVGLGGLGSPATAIYSPTSPSTELDHRKVLRERRSREKDKLGLSALPIIESSIDNGQPGSESLGLLPVTTASGTDVTAVHCAPSDVKRPEGIHGPRAFHGYVQRHPQNSGLTTSSMALPTTLPTTAPSYEDTIIADDPSMLPVPSHVVIHHLCTSAIRNGVLAIGETMRYRKKFVTAVYYKPAS